MYWCLRVKLAQHWEKFGALLLNTGDKCIVEESYRDQFWGAKPIDAHTLVGTNVLGRLLVKLRQQLREQKEEDVFIVKPLPISDFLLVGEPIGVIQGFLQKTGETVTSFPSLVADDDNAVASIQINIESEVKREIHETSLHTHDSAIPPFLHSSSIPKQQGLW